MLETPCIRRYSFTVTPLGDHVTVGSDNPTGAVNQQERPDAEQWVVGFDLRSKPAVNRKPAVSVSGILRGHTPNIPDEG